MCDTCGCYTPTPDRGPRRLGEAQWALGYLEPQNPAEVAKREDDGLNVRPRIETIYSKKGFASIWPSDLRNRFRWHGLYTQRPETDGYFMLRIRIPGGHADRRADRRDRQHLRALRARRRRRDRPPERPAPLDPDRGRAPDLERARSRRTVDDRSVWRHAAQHPRLPAGGDRRRPRSSTHPRSCERRTRPSSATPSSRTSRASTRSRSRVAHTTARKHEINDIGLVGADAPERRRRVRPLGRRRSQHEPDVREASERVRPTGAGRTDVVLGITTVFRDWGYRRARNRARMKFLVQDWGPKKFREVLEEDDRVRARRPRSARR